MVLDRKKLALIHIIKKNLGLSDELYREILFQAAGVRSAKDLNEQSFHKLMKHFVRSAYYQKDPNGITLKQKMYIEYLAEKIEWTQEHLINFIRKYYHKTDLDHLSRKDAAKTIEALKNIRFRQG
ncbi:MAG: regulatory protein GemA [Candidatus Omnitrophica bacterium]|nr:regulatory protein GemA [Candidatus Omnitrophota bacterium]